jgi:hypothetical protein
MRRGGRPGNRRRRLRDQAVPAPRTARPGQGVLREATLSAAATKRRTSRTSTASAAGGSMSSPRSCSIPRGVAVSLSTAEFLVLWALVAQPHEVLTRDQLRQGPPERPFQAGPAAGERGDQPPAQQARPGGGRRPDDPHRPPRRLHLRHAGRSRSRRLGSSPPADIWDDQALIVENGACSWAGAGQRRGRRPRQPGWRHPQVHRTLISGRRPPPGPGCAIRRPDGSSAGDRSAAHRSRSTPGAGPGPQPPRAGSRRKRASARAVPRTPRPPGRAQQQAGEVVIEVHDPMQAQ